MSALTKRTMVFRASDTDDDPEAVDAIEARVELVSAVPKPATVGDTREYVGDVVRGPRGRRWEIECEAWGFTTTAGATSDYLQDYGEFLRLDEVFRKRYVYIWRYYQSGSNVSLGAAQRAGSHAYSANGVDSFWYSTTSTLDDYPSSSAGHLPMAVECPGGFSPQVAPGGMNELSFTLVSRYPIT